LADNEDKISNEISHEHELKSKSKNIVKIK